MYKAGIDVGSTTVKMVVFDDNYEMKFSRYERHFSDVKTATPTPKYKKFTEPIVCLS